MNYWLLIIPLIAACIGWITIWVAIKMLFHPRTPKKIGGISFHGIFPKQQQQFAEKLGKLVSTQFFSFDDIQEKISSPDNLKKIMPMIENHIDDFLRHRLKEEMPMISMFIGDKTINTLKASFMKEIEVLFPQVMKQYAANLETELDLEKVVVNKLSSIPPEKLEKLLYQNMGKELQWVSMLGAAIGFGIGVLQLIIILLIT